MEATLVTTYSCDNGGEHVLREQGEARWQVTPIEFEIRYRSQILMAKVQCRKCIVKVES